MEAITSVAHSVPVNESANARLIYVLQRYLFIIDLKRKALHLSVDAEFCIHDARKAIPVLRVSRESNPLSLTLAQAVELTWQCASQSILKQHAL
jgi:hypothetical protein